MSHWYECFYNYSYSESELTDLMSNTQRMKLEQSCRDGVRTDQLLTLALSIHCRARIRARNGVEFHTNSAQPMMLILLGL